MTIKDSEGRLIAVLVVENTMSNSKLVLLNILRGLTKGSDKLLHSLLDATLQGNENLHTQLLEEVSKYIGKQKVLYGYEVRGHAFNTPINRVAPTSLF